jgi:hypothetical protein
LGSAKSIFGAGKAKIAPFGLKNRVFYDFLHFFT